MKLKEFKVPVVMLMVFFVFGVTTKAQDRNDVVTAYNEGAKAVKTDVGAAIAAFENVISLAGKVGETADDLKEKAARVLPGLYFRVAYNAMNEKKPAPEIIMTAKAAVAAADKYKSASNKENAEKVLVQGYNIMGGEYFSKNDYENALTTFDSILAINPDYLNAIYNKALIYIRQSNHDAVEQSVDQFIDKTRGGADSARANQASVMALEYFRAAGSQAGQAENFEEALTLLGKAARYGEDKDLYYYFADVYNKQGNFEKGAEYARKGLAMEAGDAEAKAKFHFQIGLAQEGKGQKDDACASFKNALHGPFADASKAKRTNLKCQ